jgi:hypothetical protein
MKRRSIFNDVDIKNVIRERLRLQTTQRYLYDQFGISRPTFEAITSSNFIAKLRLWDQITRNAFYLIVGGASFIPLTRSLFEDYLKVKTPEINVTRGEAVKELVKD